MSWKDYIRKSAAAKADPEAADRLIAEAERRQQENHASPSPPLGPTKSPRNE